MTRRAPSAVVAMVLAAGLLVGCAGSGGPRNAADGAQAGPAGVRPLGVGFLGGTPSPAPEATVTPEPGSWAGVVPPPGYRIVLISAGDDVATRTLAAAVTSYAADHGVELTRLTATTDDEVEERLEEAAAQGPDVVIGAGAGVVDVFSLLTAQHLQQQFLVLGAQLPEPTENVTSVVWAGASFRGTGISADGSAEPAAVTARRSLQGVRAGLAGVLHGVTGVVVQLPWSAVESPG